MAWTEELAERIIPEQPPDPHWREQLVLQREITAPLPYCDKIMGTSAYAADKRLGNEQFIPALRSICRSSALQERYQQGVEDVNALFEEEQLKTHGQKIGTIVLERLRKSKPGYLIYNEDTSSALRKSRSEDATSLTKVELEHPALILAALGQFCAHVVGEGLKSWGEKWAIPANSRLETSTTPSDYFQAAYLGMQGYKRPGIAYRAGIYESLQLHITNQYRSSFNPLDAQTTERLMASTFTFQRTAKYKGIRNYREHILQYLDKGQIAEASGYLQYLNNRYPALVGPEGIDFLLAAESEASGKITRAYHRRDWEERLATSHEHPLNQREARAFCREYLGMDDDAIFRETARLTHCTIGVIGQPPPGMQFDIQYVEKSSLREGGHFVLTGPSVTIADLENATEPAFDKPAIRSLYIIIAGLSPELKQFVILADNVTSLRDFYDRRRELMQRLSEEREKVQHEATSD